VNRDLGSGFLTWIKFKILARNLSSMALRDGSNGVTRRLAFVRAEITSPADARVVSLV